MNHFEDDLRRSLAVVDRSAVAPSGAVSERVTHILRRRARRHRAASGALIAAAVAITGVLVWNTSVGPAQVTTGDGGPTTTAAVASTTGPAASLPADRDSTWVDLPPDPRGPVVGADVVWTGSRALMIGGVGQDGEPVDGVMGFDPATVTWRELSSEPIPVLSPIVHWTGDLLLAVGVHEDTGNTIAAIFDPASGQWSRRATMPFGFKGGAPTPSVWTGSTLLLFSGDRPVRYDLAADEWREIAVAPIDARSDATSVWTGTEWVVWGGQSVVTKAAVGDGAAYDPATDTWRTLAASPLGARLVDGVWDGDEVIILGGRSGNANGMRAYSDGAAYDPESDEWRSLLSGPAHPGATVVGVGDFVLFTAKGGYTVYDIVADRWRNDFQGVGACFDGSAAVTAGARVLFLGCYDGTTGGAIFTPSR